METHESGSPPPKIHRPTREFIADAYVQLSKSHPELFKVLEEPHYVQEAVDDLWKVLRQTYPDEGSRWLITLSVKLRARAKGLPEIDLAEIRRQIAEKSRKKVENG